MANVDVVNLNGEKVGSIELADAVYRPGQRSPAVGGGEALPRLAAPGHAQATKNRKLVAGSGKKLWKQKGTGRARIGSVRSPLWRHGGTVHGPQPRSYDYAFPRKKLLGALRSALASKLADGKLTVVDSLEIKEAKTKLYRAALDKLGVDAHGAAGGKRQDAGPEPDPGRAQSQGRGTGAEQRSASLRSAALRPGHLLEGRDRAVDRVARRRACRSGKLAAQTEAA